MQRPHNGLCVIGVTSHPGIHKCDPMTVHAGYGLCDRGQRCAHVAVLRANVM
jgi:hypothetical protein